MATRRTMIRQWEIDVSVREKLIKRLKDFVQVDADSKDPKDKKKLMSDAQVKACLGLLKKYMPDLKAIEHTGNPDHPVVQKIIREIRHSRVNPREAGDGTDTADI